MARAARNCFERYRRSSVTGKFWSSGFPATYSASRAGSTTSHRPCLPEPGVACYSWCPEPISPASSRPSATWRAPYTCSTRAVPVSSSASLCRPTTLQAFIRRPCDRLNGEATRESFASARTAYQGPSANGRAATLIGREPPAFEIE